MGKDWDQPDWDPSEIPPWELIYLDICGSFSKFAEAFPIPNKKAVTVARVLVEQVFPRFGIPIQILSDQGKEFDNNLLKGLCDVLGIDKIRTKPYPKRNGIH